MEKQRILDIISNDIDNSIGLKNEITSKIKTWISEYNGDKYGNEVEGRSEIVWKLIKKHVNALVPNITKPFAGSNTIAVCNPRTPNDYYNAKIDEKVVNFFFSRGFNKKKFLKNIAKMIGKEGTCFIRVGWKRTVKRNEIKVSSLPPEIEDKWKKKGAKIIPTEGGYKIVTERVIENRPTAKIVRNESIRIDPNASGLEDANFIVYEYFTNISEIMSKKEFDGESVARLKAFIDQNQDTFSDYEIHQENIYGFEFKDKERKRIKVYEYWGNVDLDKDGFTEPIVAVVAETSIVVDGNSKRQRFILKAKENPFPFKRIPFVLIPFDYEPFEIFGEPLAEIISDEQKFSTAIIRGIMDNINEANNGTKFVKKGALDGVNYKRLMRGERVVEVNTATPINQILYDGNFNELPASVYNVLQMIDQQSEALTGINKYMQGIVAPDQRTTATQFNATMTQSQIRLLDIVDNIANGLKEMFMMWIEMSREYLSDKEIEEITGYSLTELRVKETKKLVAEYGIEELPEDTKAKAMQLIMKEIDDMFDRKDAKYDIDIKVGTDALKQIKINAINMFLQQSAPLVNAGVIGGGVIKHLIADFAELLELEKTADMIRRYEPKPNPLEEQMAQAELAEKIAKAKKEEALGANAMARTRMTDVKAQKEMIKTKPEIAKDYAEVLSKLGGENEGTGNNKEANKE